MTAIAWEDTSSVHLSDDFQEFCGYVFGTLYRADQRRAGETYLHGLLNCPGRKSIRRMAAIMPGRHSEQSLQQFVNQSPWDHEPIRQRLMSRLSRHMRPVAWAIEEVAFPKHGRHSAGVERQYVRSLEKVCNCQLAITVTLTGERLSIPVNWRLVVPDSWGDDTDRRSRARMPAAERPRPYWQYQLEVIDDMVLDWGMPAAPVAVDARQLATAEVLFTALENRELPYLAQVSPSLGVRLDGRVRPVAGPTGPLAPRPSWNGAVDQVIRLFADAPRTTVGWPDAENDSIVRRSQFIQIPVRSPAADSTTGAHAGSPARQLLVEWPLGKPRPRGYWITNLTDRPLGDLVALAKLRQNVRSHLETFADRFGLRDYEGRTFAGWHHHVTLASAAYVYDILSAVDADPPQTRLALA
ncbi:IS701 family transposase [Actinoplanes sp. KI2]|uniref:IS701 family transposase n=1 Tax=Actinoplanes sp. KI2 TaxID=2983315 RepID=UPI0021D5D66B|nr:IS701 family transposase [Actinoplanes sp. KI2]MCU7729571.1 IS701 family transposase [Actinoplanes sp. KI2]